MDVAASLMLYLLTRGTESSPFSGQVTNSSSIGEGGTSPAAALLAGGDALNTPSGVALLLNDNAASANLLASSIGGIGATGNVFSELNLLGSNDAFGGGEFNLLTIAYGADFTTQDVTASAMRHAVNLVV